MLLPRVPWGRGKIDQRNHFLRSMRFELGSRGARAFSRGPGSALKWKQVQRSGETSSYRDLVVYFLTLTDTEHRKQVRQLLTRFEPSWLVSKVGCKCPSTALAEK